MPGIGENIMKRRKEMGLTQEELANRMGYKSKSTINKIELGINDIPQSKVIKFANVLKTSVPYLMGWDNFEEETDQKIDLTTDILIRMEKEKDFSDLIKMLYTMDSEKIKAVKAMLDSFS